MNQLSDEKILSWLKSANEGERDKALNQLYDQHYPVIAAFITKNNGSRNDADDMFQDGIIVFYEKVRFGHLELNCSIQTYIYSVCKNLWMNRLRIQKRYSHIEDEVESIAVAPKSLTVLTDNEETEAIMRLMEKLGDDCKEALTLYYFERLQMKEIAKRMNFANEQVAKNKKSRCLKKLKTLVLQFPNLKNIFT